MVEAKAADLLEGLLEGDVSPGRLAADDDMFYFFRGMVEQDVLDLSAYPSLRRLWAVLQMLRGEAGASGGDGGSAS